MYEKFTKPDAQKMRLVGIQDYSLESQSSLSFSMSLNSFVTSSSASSMQLLKLGFAVLELR